jgi:hypothetical protein
MSCKNFVRQSLDCGRNICEAKWHDNRLKMVKVGPESCFVYVRLLHSNVMITTLEV